jgi:hypothetical protein
MFHLVCMSSIILEVPISVLSVDNYTSSRSPTIRSMLIHRKITWLNCRCLQIFRTRLLKFCLSSYNSQLVQISLPCVGRDVHVNVIDMYRVFMKWLFKFFSNPPSTNYNPPPPILSHYYTCIK